ncbi:MAG: tetratricopeptide repeat protein [Bacteroidales bacterium]|nr:tetratricopeptide repeat protein [Bacteroidales bacterium]
MKKILCILLVLSALPLSAQVDKKEVREGNRKFRKADYKNSEIDYRRAVVKDSLSVAGEYNLASSLYRQEDYAGASKALETIKDVAPAHKHADDYYFNLGDAAIKNKDYGAAVKAFREYLLLHPDDMDAKENYVYAKSKLNRSANNSDNDNNDKDGQDGQDKNQGGEPSAEQYEVPKVNAQEGGQLSPQQASQMLMAVDGMDKETKKKVDSKKAQMDKSKSRYKEKYW